MQPDRKTPGGTRYYKLDNLLGFKNIASDLTVAYARVSSNDQKKDLERQANLLSSYCTSKGWNHEIIQDFSAKVLIAP